MDVGEGVRLARGTRVMRVRTRAGNGSFDRMHACARVCARDVYTCTRVPTVSSWAVWRGNPLHGSRSGSRRPPSGEFCCTARVCARVCPCERAQGSHEIQQWAGVCVCARACVCVNVRHGLTRSSNSNDRDRSSPRTNTNTHTHTHTHTQIN